MQWAINGEKSGRGCGDGLFFVYGAERSEPGTKKESGDEPTDHSWASSVKGAIMGGAV